MPKDVGQYDFFVSYARADNANGWITRFVEELLAEHRRFSGGRELWPFFDQHAITAGADWQLYLAHGIANSRLFLAFISPSYFASEWCRKEWRAWIDTEISKHILTEGVRPVYLVEVPGLEGIGALSEQEVALKVAELCHLPAPFERFLESTAPVVKQVRRRQLLKDFAKPFSEEGLDALRRDDLHRVLGVLARDLDHHAQLLAAAARSETTVPPYNKKFSGRLDELLELRKRLKDDQAGVVCGVHGLGGVGKTELAFTYAHAFASAYPGGRFLVPCEGRTGLREAALCLGDFHEIRPCISDEERKTLEGYFAAVRRCLDERLAAKGHILVVLDNVSDTALLSQGQTDCLTTLGPKLHLLATTRLLPPAGGNWLTLGELPEADALDLLEKHRPFTSDADQVAARRIVKRLGGFALAVELVAAWLAAHPGSGYVQFADGLGLQDLEDIAGDQDVALRRHNHERRLSAVLGPALQDLKPAERRALEYAALLPPDHVALTWLRELVGRDFPEILKPTRLVAEPGLELWQRLMRLALFSPAEGETSEPRLVRVHRLVQELVKCRLGETAQLYRSRILGLAQERSGYLDRIWIQNDERWEVEPLRELSHVFLALNQDKSVALALRVGACLQKLARFQDAEALAEVGLNLAVQQFGTSSNEAIALMNLKAATRFSRGDLGEAELLLREAFRRCGEDESQTLPTLAVTLTNLGVLQQKCSENNSAERFLNGGLELTRFLYGDRHPDVATCLNNLADLMVNMGRLGDAKRLMVQALRIHQWTLGKVHPFIATDLNNLGELLRNQGYRRAACKIFQRCIAVDDLCLPAEHPDRATHLGNLGRLLEDDGRPEAATALLEEALKIDLSCFGPSNPRIALRLNNLAVNLRNKGYLPEAENMHRRVLELERSFRPVNTQKIAHRLLNLAITLGLRDKQQEAKQLLRDAWEMNGSKVELLNLRILAFRILLAVTCNEDFSVFLGQFKALVNMGLMHASDVNAYWGIEPAAEHFLGTMKPEHAVLSRALLEYTSAGTQNSRASPMMDWAQVATQSLREPWPN